MECFQTLEPMLLADQELFSWCFELKREKLIQNKSIVST